MALAPAPRWSQLTEISFTHLDQDDGLPNEIVGAVAQDGDGFMWMGTPVGVARWDGYRFRVYKPDPNKPGAIPDNYTQVLHADAAGRMWIGTSATGLVRYERESDSFIRYSVGPNGLSHVSVRSLTDDGNGGLWVGTDSGLDHLDPASGVIVRAVSLAADTPSSVGLRIRSLMHDRRGGLWVSTQLGLYWREAASAHFIEVPLPADDAQRSEPTALLEDSQGLVWIGTVQHGLYVIESRGPGPRGHVEARQVSDPLPGQPPWAAGARLQSRPITSLVESRPGEVWLGTGGQGIVAIDVQTRRMRRIRNVPTLPASLPDDQVLGLYRDRSGLIWVGTNHGASRHDPRQSAVLTMFGAPRGEHSAGLLAAELPLPASTKVGWILPTSPQRIWLATHSAGVEIVDPTGARVAALRPDASRPNTALPEDILLGLEKAPDGSVFIATKRGLYRASADGARVARVPITGRDPAASTWALLADGPTLWIGGQYDGLWKLDLRSGAAAPALADPAQQLTDARIVALARGTGGQLWIGTRNGLNRYDPATGAVLRISADGTADGLSSGFVSSLFTDRKGALWVGTYGGGFNIIEAGTTPDRPRLRRLTTAQGLHDDNINAVLDDRAGNIWFSTDNGLGSIDAATGALRVLRRAEGVAFSIYWTGSAARTAEGELLFGGAGGMTIVRPEMLQAWDYRPSVVVTEVRVSGRPVLAEPLSGLRPAGAMTPPAAPLVIGPDANSLSVEFSAMDFSAPDRIRYAYRLEGFDAAWVDTDATRRLAAYTNLPPGSYRLLLRGSNRDGVWSDQVLTLPVRVLPAWHQTPWFRVAAAMATLGALAAVVQARTRYLRMQRRELERRVEERTVELEDMSRVLQEKSRVLELTSISDPLTGLRNRRFLTQHIDTEVHASLRRALDFSASTLPHPVDTDNVFLLIDIDHFKRVNDAHGHAAGDAVLVQFAQRLQSVMRETDYVVRWGGEEFLAVARNTDRGRAEELAERVRAIMADTPFDIDSGRTLALTCSIGFACLPFLEHEPRALSWQDVVKLADMALLTAKRVGRDGWVGLYAAEGTGSEGLLARLQIDPQAALVSGEIRTASNKPRDDVAGALCAAGV